MWGAERQLCNAQQLQISFPWKLEELLEVCTELCSQAWAPRSLRTRARGASWATRQARGGRSAPLLSGESSFTRRRTGMLLFQILLLLLFIAVPSPTSSVFSVQSGGRGVKLPSALGKANSGRAEVGGPGGGAQGGPRRRRPGWSGSPKAASSGQRHCQGGGQEGGDLARAPSPRGGPEGRPGGQRVGRGPRRVVSGRGARGRGEGGPRVRGSAPRSGEGARAPCGFPRRLDSRCGVAAAAGGGGCGLQ